MIVLEDYPDAYPAWELQRSSYDKEYTISNVYDVNVVKNGAKTGISYKRKHMESEICQTVWFYESMPRIDFETKVDWHQKNQILKTSFPVDINADKASYEIQFGTIERPTHYNTSWDHARFEVCAHKYADISEGNYGVSLLNNCKYGHDIHGSDMRLTLLKCAMNPDNNTSHVNDQGMHEFTYSIYPHKNALNGADTVKYAYDLNMPMTAIKASGKGNLANEYSLVCASSDNVVIETIKEAEYSNDTVVRLYETKNFRAKTTINFGFDVSEVYLADLNEKAQKKLTVKNNSVVLDVKPFEIITLLVK
jgi:alpha-mannosidase